MKTHVTQSLLVALAATLATVSAATPAFGSCRGTFAKKMVERKSDAKRHGKFGLSAGGVLAPTTAIIARNAFVDSGYLAADALALPTVAGGAFGFAALALPYGAVALYDYLKARDFERTFTLLHEAHEGAGLTLQAEYEKLRKRGDAADLSSFAAKLRWADEHDVFCADPTKPFGLKGVERWISGKANQNLAETRAPRVDDSRQSPAPRAVPQGAPKAADHCECPCSGSQLAAQ